MEKVDAVIKTYLKLRGQKEAIEAEAKTKVKDIVAKLSKLESFLKIKADEQGVTQFKTEDGTAFLTTNDYAQVGDWDEVLNFIVKNEAYDLLEKRVSKYAVRGYIDANKAVPNGINYGTRISLSVRKPTTKVED
tara:strand:+ start:652 stop:1053 length:402 start_codon:yes stop_codon:yes gene_type:complete